MIDVASPLGHDPDNSPSIAIGNDQASTQAPVRKIIHIDMDCFYAAVEARDNPELAGKPLAVGGRPSGRGVLTTANYEARKFGCRSAMPTATALRLCPDLILIPVNMAKYKEESRHIHAIFRRYTDQIEPLSLDEAFLDVTGCERPATEIAAEIRQTIREERNLTASAGISVNKFIAKIASDWNKPDGQFVVTPRNVDAFVAQLAVGKIFGVGKITEEKLHAFGARTCGELRAFDRDQLVDRFGKFGARLYQLCRGIDNRPVSTERQRKSLSVERTFSQDISDFDGLSARLDELLVELERRWAGSADRYAFKGLVLKLKTYDFTLTTASRATRHEWNTERLLSEFHELLKTAWQRQEKPVRLLGIGLQTVPRRPTDGNSQQLHIL